MNFIEVYEDNIDLYKDSIDIFFNKNKSAYASFKPHELNWGSLKNIVLCKSQDVYIFMCNEKEIIGYGMLRGWDEGYDVPSLGILISEPERGKGLSIVLMDKLHEIAKNKKSQKVRLTVFKNNINAIKLYEKMEYQFEELNSDSLLGIKTL